MGIQWKQTYETGIPIIDEQHRNLIRLCDEAYTAVINWDSSVWEEMSAVIEELLAYTVYHFQCEEGLMSQHHYPDIESHRYQHEHFRVKIAQISADIQREQKMDGILDMIEYLIGWISEHIMVTDKSYVQDFKNRGIRF